MGNNIFRRVTIGIAKETSYGSTAASPTFTVPVTNASWSPAVEHAQNTAMLGSTYTVNTADVIRKFTEFSFTFKLDENILPLLLMQRYSIVSATASGESAVYDHTIAYESTATTSFTIFWDDPDRTDYSFSGCKFSSINLIFTTDDYALVEVSGIGMHRATDSFSTTAENPREFVGSHVDFKIADHGSTPASIDVLSLNLNHEFPLEPIFRLGSNALDELFVKADTYNADVTLLYPDNTYEGKREAGTRQESQIVITDTAREVSGSVASTNPSITIDYPAQQITEWEPQGGADDVLQQRMNLLALDRIGETDAPAKFTITNDIASY